MKDKLSKVGRIKQARQERAGMFLAAAEQRLRDAQRQQENIDALAQDYASRVDSQENTPMATAALCKRFSEQLSAAKDAQAGIVEAARTDVSRMLTDYARKRQETKLLRNLIEKRERIHKSNVLKKLARAQTPKRTSKL